METDSNDELVILQLEDDENFPNTSEEPKVKRRRRFHRLKGQVASMLDHVQSLVDNLENPTDKAHWLNSNFERKFLKEKSYSKQLGKLRDENTHAHEYFFPTLSMFEASQENKGDQELPLENPYRSNVSYETTAWMNRFQLSPMFIKLFLRDLNSNDDLDVPMDTDDPTPTSFATVRNHSIFWQPLNESSSKELEPMRKLHCKTKEFVDILLRKTFHNRTIFLHERHAPISLEKLVESIDCLQVDEGSHKNKVCQNKYVPLVLFNHIA